MHFHSNSRQTIGVHAGWNAGFTRRSYLTMLMALLGIVFACAGSLCAGPQYGVNLVTNAGFESNATGWNTLPSIFSVVNNIHHSGNYSLCVQNPNCLSYDIARELIPVFPGVVYDFSAWIKANNVTGPNGGARICVYWLDGAGNYLDGKYLGGISGTQDWTLVSAETPPMPSNAAQIVVGLGLAQAASGTAWFDDLDVHAKVDNLVFRPVLRYPNYRSTIYPGRSRSVAVGVEINGNQQYPRSALSTSVSIVDARGRTINRASISTLSDKAWENLSVYLGKALPGTYQAIAKLIEKNTGKELVSRTLPFTIAPSSTPLPKVFIDEQNRCIAGGKPFFPLGFYTSGASEEDMDRIAGMGFNCILDYGLLSQSPLSNLRLYLDQISKRNLKIMFTLRECYDIVPNQNPNPGAVDIYGSWVGSFEVLQGLVTSLKDHPAILAWYISDELTGGYLPQMAEHLDFIRKNDPDHPAYQVINSIEDPKLQMDYSDVIGVDVYPVLYQCEQNLPAPELQLTGGMTERSAVATMLSRPIWMVPECSSQRSMTAASIPPTYQQVLCESYQALVHGARGLMFYHYWEMVHENGQSQIAAMTQVSQQLKAIEPIILGTDASSTRALISMDPRVSVLTRIVGSDTYAIAVNPYSSSIPCTFQLGSTASATTAAVGPPGFTTSTMRIMNRQFSDTFEPFGVRVYKLIGN